MLQNNENPIIYVFVRTDIGLPQICVQSCHAVAQIIKEKPYKDMHPTIIVYGIKSITKLKGVMEHLNGLGVSYKEFLEPDRTENDRLTAIATAVYYERITEFKKYQLLK